jgi:hypothetical protein
MKIWSGYLPLHINVGRERNEGCGHIADGEAVNLGNKAHHYWAGISYIGVKYSLT